jgi:hypothetical protein
VAVEFDRVFMLGARSPRNQLLDPRALLFDQLSLGDYHGQLSMFT